MISSEYERGVSLTSVPSRRQRCHESGRFSAAGRDVRRQIETAETFIQFIALTMNGMRRRIWKMRPKWAANNVFFRVEMRQV